MSKMVKFTDMIYRSRGREKYLLITVEQEQGKKKRYGVEI